jgi:hypothetical protein
LFRQSPPELVKVYSFYSADLTDSFYTTSEAEGIGASGKYSAMGGQWYVYNSQAEGALPFYRLWSSNITDHFYTLSEDERAYAKTVGYIDEGILGYVYPSKVAGSVPLYRYWNGAIGDHKFHAGSANPYYARAFAMQGYTYEGVAAYVFNETAFASMREGGTNSSNIPTSCVDSDSGKDYYVRGNAVSTSSNGLVFENLTDACISSMILREAYCYSDVPEASDIDYVCPNGCNNGACLKDLPPVVVPKDVDACSNISTEILAKAKSLEGAGNVVVRTEGNKVQKNEYVLVGGENGGGLWKLKAVSNDSSTPTKSLVEFENVMTGAVQKATISGDGSGTIELGGYRFLIYRDSRTLEGDEYIILTWGDFSSAGVVGTERDLFVGCKITTPDTGRCGALLDSVKNPKDFESNGYSYRDNWNYTYAGSWYVDGARKDVMNYGAGWWTYSQEGDKYINYYLSYTISVFNDSSVDAAKWVQDNYGTNYWCKVYENNRAVSGMLVAYVCNWDLFQGQYVSSNHNYNSESREIFWAVDNKVIRAYISKGGRLTDDEVIKIMQNNAYQILNSMRDNRGEYVSSYENYNLFYPLEFEIDRDMESCGSDLVIPTNPITNESCSSFWECKMEPVICPEYGQQKRTCIDRGSCQLPVIEETHMCSPGICSGCYVPKWFSENLNYKSNDNKCIPYGFRFEQQMGVGEEFRQYKDTDTIPAGGVNGGPGQDYKLEVLSDTAATLVLYYSGKNYTYKLIEGETIPYEVPDERDIYSNLSMYIDEIIYDANNPENNAVTITFTMTEKVRKVSAINAYCDIDGVVKEQKSIDYYGEWAKCQNNYECRGNFCSEGECLNLNYYREQAKGLKGLLVKALCRITNMIDDKGYEACLAEYY